MDSIDSLQNSAKFKTFVVVSGSTGVGAVIMGEGAAVKGEMIVVAMDGPAAVETVAVFVAVFVGVTVFLSPVTGGVTVFLSVPVTVPVTGPVMSEWASLMCLLR